MAAPSSVSVSASDDCISIRARVRKSHRAIDPEFDACREMLVRFVILNNNAAAANTAALSDSKKLDPTLLTSTTMHHCGVGGPSLVLTPIPSITTTTMMMTPRARSLSFSNRSSSSLGGGVSRGVSPANNSINNNYYSQRRSFGSSGRGGTAGLTSSMNVSHGHFGANSTLDDADQNDTNDMMMEVPLEDDGDQQQQQQLSSEKSLILPDYHNYSNSSKLSGLPPTQPSSSASSLLLSITNPQSSSQQQHQKNQLSLLRHPSPLVMHRSTSGGGASSTNISTSHSDPPPGGGLGSAISIRSRSRSRSRSITNNRRLRSLGAAVMFANAAAAGSSSSLGNSNNSGTSSDNHYQQQHCDILEEGGQETSAAWGDGSNHGRNDHHVIEPITIPLVNVLGVDEEIPRISSSRRSGGSHSSGCGNNNSEFYSSAASDIGVAKEVASAAGNTTATTTTDIPSSVDLPLPPHNHPLLTSPRPSTIHGSARSSYRIFLHTLSSGYLEFSLDNANSHDTFMAYLKVHLPPDRIPRRDYNKNSNINNSNIGSASYISSTAQTKLTNNVGMLRAVVLTPTKETTTTATTLENYLQQQDQHPQQHGSSCSSSPPPLTPTILPSGSASVCSNRIDKLHSKMMHRRLQHEKNARPPLVRIQERMVNWMSSIIDCGCCLDTTVAPLEMTSSSVSGTGTGVGSSYNKDISPKTKALKKKGIGGLSFEVESCISGGSTPMPNLSFER